LQLAPRKKMYFGWATIRACSRQQSSAMMLLGFAGIGFMACRGCHSLVYGGIMKKIGLSVLPAFVGIALSLSAWPALATIYQSNTGLVSPGTTITFSEGGGAQETPLGNNYGGTGVSFSGLFQDNGTNGAFSNTSPPDATNFNNQRGVAGPFEIDFAAAVRDAVFTFVTNASSTPSIIQSFLGATLVESASVSSSTTNPNDIYGFTGSDFDRIVVTPETAVNQAALIDNLEFNVAAAVPEPSTWAMMILGFAGVGFMAYRRRHSAMLAA
jgi:PEP-CTERM motif